MNAIPVIYVVDSKQDQVDFSELSDFLYKSGILEKFSFAMVSDPVIYFRQDFLDYISQNGMSSLFNFTLSLEDVTSKSMNINELESVILKFISKLNGASKILIVDPYLYCLDGENDLFEKSIRSISEKVQRVILITSPRHIKNKIGIDNKIRTILPGVIIDNFTTDDVHDRFWIGMDIKKGIVMGTSFNGIGKKLALVDIISEGDIDSIVKEIEKIIGVSL